MDRMALISKDGRYRYALTRRWSAGRSVLFVMLNPSTADAEQDDPTIRRCIGFARRWGFGGIVVWNLYAYRATDPAELDRVDDPLGPLNEDHLWAILRRDPFIVAAWGAKPNRGRYKFRERSVQLGPLYDYDVHHLGLTKDGHPKHPLYVPYSVKPEVWKYA